MEQEELKLEITMLRKELRKKANRIKKLKNGEEIRNLYDEIDRRRKTNYDLLLRIDALKKEIFFGKEKYGRLETVHKKLQEKFEANFKFHEYIKDVLDQTADLMENRNAVREQEPTVQERVQTTGQKRRTQKSNGASAGA